MNTDRFNVPRGMWLLVALIMAMFMAWDGVRLASPGLLISSVGMLMLGISLFLRPPVFFRSLAAAAASNAPTSSMQSPLPTALALSGFGLLLIGGVLRFALGA